MSVDAGMAMLKGKQLCYYHNIREINFMLGPKDDNMGDKMLTDKLNKQYDILLKYGRFNGLPNELNN